MPAPRTDQGRGAAGVTGGPAWDWRLAGGARGASENPDLGVVADEEAERARLALIAPDGDVASEQ
jgi:hypothetical protein